MEIRHIPKEQITDQFLENVHKNIFNEAVPADFFKFDACLVAEENNELLAYILIKEITSCMVDIAWGGSFKNARGTVIKKMFNEGIGLLLKYYSTITFQTRNTNLAMIKLGLLGGFLITGTTLINENELFVSFARRRN